MKTIITREFRAFWPRALAAGLLAGVLCGNVMAADYLGATAVLHQVEARRAGAKPSGGTNAATQLADDMTAFRRASASLPPAEAATQWLGLVDRWAKLRQETSDDFDGEGGNELNLMAALPPPAAWGELARAVAARPPAKGAAQTRELGLRFLTALLTSDTNAQTQIISTLAAKARTTDPSDAFISINYLREIGQALLRNSQNPEVILDSLNRQVDAAAGERQQILIPNLVEQVGAAQAEEFLRRALLAPNVTLQFEQAGETSRLAQKLALELMPRLKSPPWQLVNSLDAVDLFEAIDKQFGTPTNSSAAVSNTVPGLVAMADASASNYDFSGKSSAELFYLMGLISKNRVADATAVAKTIQSRFMDYLSTEAFQQMEHAGYTTALDNFFHELLAQNPNLPFWNQYVEVSARAGQTERMVTLVRSTLKNPDLDDHEKTQLQEILFKALLAADDVDDAVVAIRQLAAQDDSPTVGENFNAGQLGVILARLGFLLQKPDLTAEGIGIAKQWLAKQTGANGGAARSLDVIDGLVEILTDLNRGPEAEALLGDMLAASTVPSGPSTVDYGDPGGGPQRSEAFLYDLAVLYHQSGRYQDIIDLVTQSPDWGAKDLSDLMSKGPDQFHVPVMGLHTGSSPQPLAYLVADALLHTGQPAAARKILAPLQDNFPGLDRCYELLLALDGTNAIPQLDQWFARDQFEERPLIWKAHLLRQENRLAEAEKTIRQAVAIDPSDGEEGRGDRMRAYAELAEIRAAQGDQKEADFYREVVKAIRLSEDADQFYQAGLLKHAIGMYEQGLNHFADAYCIQSRLAIQLSALGKTAEAEEHYRRAYELMPDSFGRVESHCFGCERAFDGERAQNIALEVFTKFAAEHPNKPQVHYLLGYLRGEQERYNEARTNYLAAVRLDPDYLNAWVKLQEVSLQVLAPAEEHNEIALNILRLDPLRRHAQSDFSEVTDLAGLWNMMAMAISKESDPVTNLFAFTASKLALEKAPADARSQRINRWRAIRTAREKPTPAEAVSQTALVQVASQMIMASRRLYEY